MKRFFVALLLAASPFVRAYPTAQALDNLSEDYADCVSYYTILITAANQYSQGDQSGKWAKMAEDYKGTLVNSITMLRATMVDKPDKYVTSKIDLHMQKNQAILRDEGLDRLFVMYANQCKALMEDPRPRMEYWLNKK